MGEHVRMCLARRRGRASREGTGPSIRGKPLLDGSDLGAQGRGRTFHLDGLARRRLLDTRAATDALERLLELSDLALSDSFPVGEALAFVRVQGGGFVLARRKEAPQPSDDRSKTQEPRVAGGSVRNG